MNFKIITADEREKLYHEIWAEPVSLVSKRYGISDTMLRKHCIRVGIPLPPVGHWAKVKVGKKVYKSPLPPVTGELRRHVRNYNVKYIDNIEILIDEALKSNEELFLLRDESERLIKEICSNLQVKDKLLKPHRLIEEHKEGLKNRKKASSIKHKDLIVNVDKPILPIRVSATNMDRAYRILDIIIKTVEEIEGFTQVGKGRDGDIASFVIIRSEFKFEVKEDIKNNKSVLILSISASSWFRNNTIQNLVYKDIDKSPLEDQVGDIIYNMAVVANRNYAADILDQRQSERELEEKDRQRTLEKIRKAEVEELKLLEQVSSDWSKAQMIRKFATAIEIELDTIQDCDKKEKVLKWLSWALDKADWLDPLTDKEDNLLGKSKHLFDIINDLDT